MIDQINRWLQQGQDVAQAAAVLLAENTSLKSEVEAQAKAIAALQAENAQLKKPAPAPAPPVVTKPESRYNNPMPDSSSYKDPVRITRGGTYTFNVQSLKTDVAAVEIETGEPVVFLNCNVRSAGRLFRSAGHKANITILNTRGFGLDPTIWTGYEKPRNFLACDDFVNIRVENCETYNTAGINLGGRYYGDNTGLGAIAILYNKISNIDGRIYGNRVIASNFVGFNFRNPITHAYILWNQVVNEPGKSAVEDNINMSNTRGYADNYIEVNNNYIEGAYPFPATAENYSGGGIIADSWKEGTNPKIDSSAFIKVYENQVVKCAGYGLQVASAHDTEWFNNRVISASRLPNGQAYATHNISMKGEDYYRNGNTYNNLFHDNVLGVMGKLAHQRNDELYFPNQNEAKQYNNVFLPDKVITPAMEQAERVAWETKVRLNKIELGVR